MRFRQVHLDFHTSEAIPAIGASFSKEQFQSMLKLGHVDSITVFSKCHHGWAYHPSKANEMYPHLTFDLLGAMIEAAHEIGVRTPVYISAGLDEKLARRHPDWLIRNKQEQTQWAKSFMEPGYHEFCFNSPYLDVLLRQVEEVVQQYDADGLFLDIVGVRTCYCQYCIQSLREAGQHPGDEQAVLRLGERTYANYTARIQELINRLKPGLPVFHNGGHIRKGRRDLARMNSHIEIESLPTGGWGYDHFPSSVRYVQQLGMEYLGMTGKFHTSWGEFGGYKHPNALRYEVALSLANGAKCSIGDQLHPSGTMDEATYRLIGAAYREAEQKEAWCTGVTNVADVALLSPESLHSSDSPELASRLALSETGAVRMLLEGHILFDVADRETDLTPYRAVILPDEVQVDSDLQAKLSAYLAQGGKLLATGSSGLRQDGTGFAFDFGVAWKGSNPYRPDYFKPAFDVSLWGPASYIMYGQGQDVALTSGEVLGYREHPYFNRETFTFCSHQHTPSTGEPAGPGMVEGADGVYIAWNLFEDYAIKGSLILRETVLYALGKLLGRHTLTSTLPAQGIVTLQHQAKENRYVNHLLYASPVKRGDGIEVIEDIVPLSDIQVTAELPGEAAAVTLEPQGTALPFDQQGTTIRYTVPSVECHQIVVIQML
ncbi:alpha-amylase family protein [Paenibacillus gansuensis]|uniref:Alpha-amylase family protein n=1 Tax=Paenibacillus gansuensis TaxID=306542 RepID=A0ABW5PBN3_9BACL